MTELIVSIRVAMLSLPNHIPGRPKYWLHRKLRVPR